MLEASKSPVLRASSEGQLRHKTRFRIAIASSASSADPMTCQTTHK